MATATESKPIWLFYHLQGERGESAQHPNACRVTLPSGGTGKPTLAGVRAAFPLTGSGNFHFRFQALMPDKQVIFVDRMHPDDEVPTVNGNIIAKVLRLDDLKCTSRNALPLKPRAARPAAPSPAGSAAAPRPAASSPPSAGGAAATAAPPKISAPPAAAASGAAPAAANGARTGPVGSPNPAPGGFSPHEIPGVKPVEIDYSSIVVPDEVDDDLKDKSDYVKASVMARRLELRRIQEERLAEAAARDAAAKAEQEEKDVLRSMHGPKLKDWGEEMSGQKRNIRVLLSTLQNVLWPDAKWEPVTMAKLIEPKRVQMTYMKAIRIVHPDKHNHMDNTQKYLATTVFHYLEQAFREFQEKEMA